MTPVPLARIMVEPLVRAALLEDLGRAGDLTTDAIVPAGLIDPSTVETTGSLREPRWLHVKGVSSPG